MARIQDIFFLDEKGLTVPDLDTVYQWFCDEYRNIYGADVILTPDTQDGQWIGIQAQAVHDLMDVCALIYNSFSPATAMADALDKNVRISGISRKIATYSMCDVKIIGTAGTEISGGSVKDNVNRVWNLPDRVTVPVSGEIIVTATAAEPGEWRALPNTLTVINTPTRGWISVTNENEATPGNSIETDAELRRRQAQSVAMPSQSILSGIVGEVSTIVGVTRLKAYENDSDTTDSNGIPAHSNCIVVEGGDVNLIADAIFRHKTAGSGTYGDTAIEVTDKYGLQSVIKFQRPEYVRIQAEIEIKPLKGYSNVYAEEIKSRLEEYINGLDIGDNVFIARLIPVILACNTSNTDTFDIVSVKAAKSGEELQPQNIDILFNEAALTDISLITVKEQGKA